MKFWRYLVIALHTATSMLASTNAMAGQISKPEPLVILEQGSFAVGGTEVTVPGTFDPRKPRTPAGQTYHGDHAYVFYQIPVDARKYPLVMWHGYGQFSETGRQRRTAERVFRPSSCAAVFPFISSTSRAVAMPGAARLRRRSSPPRMNSFGLASFVWGSGPIIFDGVQFSHDPEALNQYFRQDDAGHRPVRCRCHVRRGGGPLFNRIGRGILVTHSHSGGLGWSTAMKNENIKAIVSFEPGSNFVFPEGEVPDPMPSAFDTLQGIPVPMSDFMALTRVANSLSYTWITSPTSHPNVFSISGRGTVVTGRVERGKVKVGEEIEIVGFKPDHQEGRDRRRDVPQAARLGRGGRQHRRAAARRGKDRRRARPGAGQARLDHAAHEVQGEVYVLSKEEGGRHTPFFNGYRPQFYIRTTDVTGSLHLGEGVEMIMPGDNTEITAELIAPGRARKGSALRHPRRRPHGRRRHGDGDHRIAGQWPVSSVEGRNALGRPIACLATRALTGSAMRDIIQMACGECKRRNYSTTKNKKKTTERIELSKFCPFCRKHTPHKEQK